LKLFQTKAQLDGYGKARPARYNISERHLQGARAMSSARDIPIIDVSALYGGDDAALDALAAEIGAACRGIGFFAITGHGIPAAVIEGAFKASHDFFYADETVKRAVSYDLSDANRGWIGMEREQLDQSKAPDFKQAFNVGLDMAADDPRILAGEMSRGRLAARHRPAQGVCAGFEAR
jgi:isopenicillin N synthase-like dioxygenase